MPISFRLPFIFHPGWSLRVQIRVELPPPITFAQGREADYDLAVRALTKRLPPHLVRDVVRDGE